MSANAALMCVIDRLNSTGGIASTVVSSKYTGGELGTGATLQNWSVTPTSTTFHKGDRIRIRVAACEANGTTMGNGYTVTFDSNGYTADADGDSFVTFTENLRFLKNTSQHRLAAYWRKNNPSLGIGYPLEDIVYGNGYFCGWAQISQAYATDPDGTWTYDGSGATFGANTLIYGGGYWVAAGSSAGNGYYKYRQSTPNGSWSSGAQNGQTTCPAYIKYGNGYFIGLAAAATTHLYTTAPGSTWTAISGLSGTFQSLDYGNGYWVVGGGGSGNIYYSTGPTSGSWTSVSTGATAITHINYVGGYWIAQTGANSTIYYTTDPTGTWTSKTLPVSIPGSRDVFYDEVTSTFWISDTNGVSYASTPGGTWTRVQNESFPGGSSAKTLQSIAYDSTNGIYAAGSSTSGQMGTLKNSLIPQSTTTIHLTDTASTVSTAAVDREAWTSRGSGVADDVTNTSAGPVSPIQTTDTAGGTVVDWWTKQLQACTLGGVVEVRIQGKVSSTSTYAVPRVEIAVCNSDGSSPTVWGASNHPWEFSTTEVSRTWPVSGDDVSISAGQRLRIRLYLDDGPSVDGNSTTSMVTGRTVTLYYNGTADNSTGDSRLTFPISLSEYSSSTTYSGSFTADSHISKNDITQTFTANANISKTDIPGSFTADAYIKKTIEGSFTADAVITKTTESSFTADAHISKNDITQTFTADAYISKTTSGDFTADAHISKTIESSFTADSTIAKQYSGTFTADSYVKKTTSGTFTADAYIKRTFVYGVGGGGVVGQDSFTDTDRALTSHTAEVGGSWSAWWEAGAYGPAEWRIESNQRRSGPYTSTGDYSIDYYGVWRLGTGTLGDGTLRDHVTGPWIRGSGIAARLNGTNNAYILAGSGGGGNLKLYRLTNGALTIVAQSGGYLTVPYLRLDVSGSSPTVLKGRYWTGTEPGTWDIDTSDNTAANQTASGGFGAYGEGYDDDYNIEYTTGDDFSVTQSGESVDGSGLTADAYISKTTSGSVTADAYIKNTISNSFTADSNIANTVSGSFTADANITGGVTTYTSSFSADAYIQNTLSGDFTADAYIQKTLEGTFTADAQIGKTTSSSFTADAYIQKTVDSSFSADATISKTTSDTFTADALIQKTTEGTFSADSIIAKTYSGDFTADAFVKKTTEGTFTADGHVQNTISGDFVADAHIKNTFNLTFGADAYIQNTIGGTFTADAEIEEAQATTYPGDFTADAYIQNTLTGQFSADALILKTTEGSFSADAYVKQTQSNVFAANATIQSTIEGTFTADATVSKTYTGDFTADAFVQNTLANNFTADAMVSKTTASSFSADAYVQNTTSGSFTSDAYILNTSSGQFTADSTILKTSADSFTADAYISKVGKIVWTTPGNQDAISATPTFAFTIPVATGNISFHIEIDTVNTFDSGSLRSYKSAIDQTGWEYHNGSGWVPIPAYGVSNTYAGNEARFTVPTALSNATWYRRIRGGV